jgi:hypothetical protein
LWVRKEPFNVSIVGYAPGLVCKYQSSQKNLIGYSLFYPNVSGKGNKSFDVDTRTHPAQFKPSPNICLEKKEKKS